ncbi:MAG TPA: YncE family protein [Blastocatellia bacterium]|nr:YncE family protein [Blastocatellia bacterium]
MLRASSLLLLLFLLTPARAQETMIVVQKRADSVGFYDTATGRPLATVPVGARPHEIAMSGNGRLAYVTNYGVDSYTAQEAGGNTISIIDPVRQERTGEIELGDFHRPHGITRGRSGMLYVTTDRPAALLVIDPAKRRIVKHYATGSELPHMVVVTADETKAYTADAGSASVTVISLREGKVSKHISIGGIPMGPALSPDGRRLFVANRNGNAVVVIDTRTDEIISRIEVAGSPARAKFTPDGKHLLISLMESGEVAVLDPAALKELHRFRVGEHPEGMNIDPSGRQVYVSAQGEDKVVRFSLADWKPNLEIKTGARPDPMVIFSRRTKSKP